MQTKDRELEISTMRTVIKLRVFARRFALTVSASMAILGLMIVSYAVGAEHGFNVEMVSSFSSNFLSGLVIIGLAAVLFFSTNKETKNLLAADREKLDDLIFKQDF